MRRTANPRKKILSSSCLFFFVEDGKQSVGKAIKITNHFVVYNSVRGRLGFMGERYDE